MIRRVSRFLLLFRQVWRLLLKEQTLLQRRHAAAAHNCSEMTFSPQPRETAPIERQLRRIYTALEQITQRHAEFIALVQERFRLRSRLHHQPVGNAGYYARLRTREKLAKNKQRLTRLFTD